MIFNLIFFLKTWLNMMDTTATNPFSVTNWPLIWTFKLLLKLSSSINSYIVLVLLWLNLSLLVVNLQIVSKTSTTWVVWISVRHPELRENWQGHIPSIIPATLQVEGESNQLSLFFCCRRRPNRPFLNRSKCLGYPTSDVCHVKLMNLKRCQAILMYTQFSTYCCERITQLK